MVFGWPSPALPKLLNDTENPLTSTEASWVAIIFLPGTMCGSIFAGFAVDCIGRKLVTQISSVLFILSWITMAYAKTVPALIAGRVLGGISDGLAFCTFPMYLGEISNPEYRGHLGSAVTIDFNLGILLINVIGSYSDLVTTAWIATLLPLLSLLTFSWMPESPYYLIMKGKHEKAKRSLHIFSGNSDVDLELSKLIRTVQEENACKGSHFELFTIKSNRKALYIIMGVRFAQQFSGIIAIMFYVQIIFREVGNCTPEVASIIYFSLQVLFSSIFSCIADKIDRLVFLTISLVGCFISLLIQGAYFYAKNITDVDVEHLKFLPALSLLLFVISYAIGIQTIPVILLSELFPTNVKAFALSISDVYFAFVATIAAKFFQITKDEYGLHVPFFTFAACCAIGLLFILLYVPETKGKSLEQIQEQLKGNLCHR